MIRASDCPIACSALTPSSSSAARFHDVIQPWSSVVTIASPAAATAADARAGSAVTGRPSGAAPATHSQDAAVARIAHAAPSGQICLCRGSNSR